MKEKVHIKERKKNPGMERKIIEKREINDNTERIIERESLLEKGKWIGRWTVQLK